MKFFEGDVVSYINGDNKKCYGTIVGLAHNNGGDMISHYNVRTGIHIQTFHISDIYLYRAAL